MVLSLLYQRKAVRLVVVIKKVLVRRTEERTANVVPSFFFFYPLVRWWQLKQARRCFLDLKAFLKLFKAFCQKRPISLMIVNFVHIMSFLQHCNKKIAPWTNFYLLLILLKLILQRNNRLHDQSTTIRFACYIYKKCACKKSHWKSTCLYAITKNKKRKQ